MGGHLAVPRKKRNHPAIKRDEKAFGEALHKGDTWTAAKIVVGTALEVLGPEGLLKAIEHGFSVIERIKKRGLGNGYKTNYK